MFPEKGYKTASVKHSMNYAYFKKIYISVLIGLEESQQILTTFLLTGLLPQQCLQQLRENQNLCMKTEKAEKT